MEPSLNLGHLAEEFAKLLVDDPAAVVPEDTIALEAGERRDVVILFLDIVGYTKLAEALDPEQLKFVMANTLQVLTNQIKRCGGVVEKYIGDAIMAVFGRNHAAEDDDRRAVLAGWGIFEKLHDVNAILAQKGLAIQARIGVNRGLIVTGQLDGHETVTGEAINIAQRLEAQAEPGAMLIADTVYQRCRDSVTCETLAPLHVKNKTAPVQAHRVVALRADPTTPVADDAPLVGRATELARVADALCAAAAACVTLPICGGAGSGKSRLLRDALGERRPLWISADAFGMAPYQLLGDLLRAWQRQAEVRLEAWSARMPEDSQRSGVQSYVHYLCDLAGEPLDAATRGQLQQMDPKARHIETLLAFRRWLIAVARDLAHCTQQPLVLVCDNWQWMPEASRDALTQILAQLPPDTPLLCCVVSRDPVELSGDHVWPTLTLEPLPPAALDYWMQHVLPAQSLSPVLARQIWEQTGGNPLYIREMLQFAQQHPGHLTHLALEDRLPSTIASLVLSRFDQLSRVQKLAVQMAAVASRASSVALLQHLFAKSQITDDAVAMCRELCASGWLRTADEQLRVAQPMVADVAYSTMLHVNRRKLHAAVATWCRDTMWDRDATWEAFLAEQWHRAGEPAPALECYLRAADAARSQYAYRDAAQLYRQADACVQSLPAESTMAAALTIATRCAELYEALGDAEAWLQAIRDGLARAAPDSDVAARLQVRRWEWEYRFGARDVAVARLREYIAATAVTPHDDARLLALIHLCNASFEQGLPADEDFAVLRAARAQIAPGRLQRLLDNVVFNYYKNTDQLARAADYFDTVLAPAAHDPYHQHLNDLLFCSCAWDRGADFAAIAERGAVAQAYFDETGWLRGAAWGAFYQAAACWRLGQWTRAQQLLARMLPRVEAAGDGYMTIRLLLVAAGLAASEGRWTHWTQTHAQLQRLTSGTPDDQRAVQSSLALMMAQTTDDTERLRWADAVLQRNGSASLAPVELDELFVTQALRAADRHEWDGAATLITERLPHLRHEGKLWLLGLALRVDAQCAVAHDRWDAAHAAFAESTVLLQRCGAHVDAVAVYRHWWNALARCQAGGTAIAEHVRQQIDAAAKLLEITQ